MELFLKASGGILVGVILWLCLHKYGKDISLLLTVAVCCMVMLAAVTYLRPVLDFFHKLQSIGNLNSDFVEIVLKIVGISLLTEICSMICKDAGNESMGKTLQILSTGMVLWLSLPVFEKLLSLIDTILGNI